VLQNACKSTKKGAIQYCTFEKCPSDGEERRGGEKKGKTHKSFRIGLDPKFSTK
jgi:hypothetical protein